MYLDYTKEEYERMSNSIDYLIDYTIDKDSLFSYKNKDLILSMYIENIPNNYIDFMLELKNEKNKETVKFSINTNNSAMAYFPLSTDLGIMCFLEENKLFHVSRSLKSLQGSIEEKSKSEELILSQQKSNMLHYFFDKIIICKEILIYLKDFKKEYVEKLTDKINMNNYQDYKTLLSLNKDKIFEILIANNNGFNVLSLNKEDRDILNLKTDLNFDFNKKEQVIINQKKDRSLFNRLFNKNKV